MLFGAAFACLFQNGIPSGMYRPGEKQDNLGMYLYKMQGAKAFIPFYRATHPIGMQILQNSTVLIYPVINCLFLMPECFHPKAKACPDKSNRYMICVFFILVTKYSNQAAKIRFIFKKPLRRGVKRLSKLRSKNIVTGSPQDLHVCRKKTRLTPLFKKILY
jgi:hypothetical protein